MHLNYALSYYEQFIHACCVHTFFDLVSINQNVTTPIQICLHSINRWIEPLEKMESFLPFFSFLMWNKWSVATSVYFWINTDTLLQVWSDLNWPQFTDPTTHSWPVLHSSSEKKKKFVIFHWNTTTFCLRNNFCFLLKLKWVVEH